ncbi:DUF3626 domain-containing protein [Kribbella sp. NPDC003557]|uniref:DUF3626 domain-containing protein n=1 Tax=Kribbella sp. NPDC003557 TaxID=3154449 RepID=UPI00339EC8A1
MLTVQFHPNWPHGSRTVIESIAADGFYRSQFTTGISNGGLTAFQGGDRWRWESRLFSGRYDGGPETDRPIYGVWNRHADPYGGAIRFGSSYLRLKPEAIDRATFCFPDSAREPSDFGDRHSVPHLCDLADPAYRGPGIVALARSLGPELTPDLLGVAARSGLHPAQPIKYVWHCLARFGRQPASWSRRRVR